MLLEKSNCLCKTNKEDCNIVNNTNTLIVALIYMVPIYGTYSQQNWLAQGQSLGLPRRRPVFKSRSRNESKKKLERESEIERAKEREQESERVSERERARERESERKRERESEKERASERERE